MGLSKQIIACAALAGLSVASPAPQQLDFAQISAAPSVASGPATSTLDLDGSQTASLYTSFTVTGGATASATAVKRGASSNTKTISSDVTDSSYNAKFGQISVATTINSGVTYWINGGSTHNFFGNLVNYGRLFVSQTAYLAKYSAGGQTSDWVGVDSSNGNLKNAQGALVQLNDYGSKSAPTYDWFLNQIDNSGTVQWCGRGDTGGSTYQMYSNNDLTNNGLISFEQFSDNKGASFNIRNTFLSNSASASNIYNNGAIRIINTNYQQVQNVYGNGCWQIGKGGILYLQDGAGYYQNPNKGSTLAGQSIIFQDSTADLHMDTLVYSKNSDFGAQLYGFGTGNAIEFYEKISTFSYSASTGVLTVTFSSKNKVNIKFGQGYDASKFSQAKNPSKYNTAGYNAIFYNGPAPTQSAPAQCSISAPVCSDLSNGLPPVSTPSTSSSTVSSTSTSSSSSSSSSIPSTTSSTLTTSTVSSTVSSASSTVSSTSSLIPSVSVTSVCTFTVPSSTDAPYTPYYPALATSYTTDPALTGTTTSGQACPTTPEEGTYCGFINPNDPCAAQPDGYGPVPTPDTASAFRDYSVFHSLATAAPTVVASQCNTQYNQVFRDLDGSVSAQSYMGQYTLQSYDVEYCAKKCDATNLCTSFNIYAERDPSLNPAKNDSTAFTVWGYWCPNPASMTTFRCTLWGSSIDASLATNKGGWREDFEVVIAASNGYDRTNVTIPQDPTSPVVTTSVSSTISSSVPSSTSSSTSTTSAGTTSTSSTSTATPTSPSKPPTKPWGNGHNCGGKAINAGQYWMGSRYFPGPFNPQVCSDYALAQNAANANAAKNQGSASYSTCKMFNAVYYHKNGVPHGTYCSLYSTQLGDSWATYGGGKTSSGDQFDCKQSWTWTLAA